MKLILLLLYVSGCTLTSKSKVSNLPKDKPSLLESMKAAEKDRKLIQRELSSQYRELNSNEAQKQSSTTIQFESLDINISERKPEEVLRPQKPPSK